MRYWLAQVLGWGAYYVLIVLAAHSIDTEKLSFEYVLEITFDYLSSIFFTHLGKLVFIRFKWLDWSLSKLILPVIGISIITATLIYLSDSLFDYFFVLIPEENLVLWQHIVVIGLYSVLCFLWNTIYFVYHISQKSRKQELSNLKLQANNKEIQLKNLQSQLNPHFLFNSLNSIRALVDLDPDLSKKSITRLSSLLRISLQFGKHNLVSIKDEIQLVEHYLKLEKMRFEDRLHFQIDISEDLLNQKIPPFTIQLLVENAIKHGISQRKQGGEIQVVIFLEDEWMVLNVHNSGTLKSKVDLGVGLINIRKRLLLQYGKENIRFTLDQIEGEENVLAQIKIRA